MNGPDAANAPLFRFEGAPSLNMPSHLAAIASTVPAGLLTLSGPAEKLDAAHWPVRGDLAHISLAGRCFVPHYAVPMPHVLSAGAALRKTSGEAGEAMVTLAAGAGFDVLDIAGGWCWGQVQGSGLVGYVPQDALAAA